MKELLITVHKLIGNDMVKIGEGITDISGIVEFEDLPCRAVEYSLVPNAVPYAGVFYEIILRHSVLALFLIGSCV